MALRTILVALSLVLSGCAGSPERPAKSSYGCMTAVVKQHVPAGLPDEEAHCLAAGLIARYCSLPEAWLAAAGKELRDFFGPGNMELRDWRASRRGIGCARRNAHEADIAACCGDTETPQR